MSLKSPEERYAEAQTGDELLLVLSDGIALGAAGIIQSLKPPKRGSLIRALMQRLRPARYKEFVERENVLWGHMLLVVLQRMHAFLSSRIPVQDLEPVLETAGAYAPGLYHVLARVSPEDRKRFSETYVPLLLEFMSEVSSGSMQPESARLARALGRAATEREAAAFLRETYVEDPTYVAAPWLFVERWNNLPGELRRK